MASAALRGFLLGLAIAATPGPMFFLCLRRTLNGGWRAGFATGLGIATADCLYAALAATGIGAAGALLGGAQRWITLAGGLALLLLGVRQLARSTQNGGIEGRRIGPFSGERGSFASGLVFTLGNPATILAFGALFAGVGAAVLPRTALPAAVGGTALGSLTWWVTLTAVAALAGRAAGPRLTRGLTLASGLALAAFGAAAVLSVLR